MYRSKERGQARELRLATGSPAVHFTTGRLARLYQRLNDGGEGPQRKGGLDLLWSGRVETKPCQVSTFSFGRFKDSLFLVHERSVRLRLLTWDLPGSIPCLSFGDLHLPGYTATRSYRALSRQGFLPHKPHTDHYGVHTPLWSAINLGNANLSDAIFCRSAVRSAKIAGEDT